MNDRDVDREVRSALAAGRSDAGPHPEPDVLFHYYAGELSAADADAVQGHLALCRACAQVMLDFETFPHIDAPSEDDVPTVREVDAGWADLQARLGRGGAVRRDESEEPELGLGASHGSTTRPRGAVVVPLTPRGGVPARPALAGPRASAVLQVAAVLLAVTSLGLGGYAVILKRSLAQAEAPVGDLFEVNLDGVVMRGAPATRRAVVVPVWAKGLALSINPGTETVLPQRCHVEIVRTTGRPDTVWSGFSRVNEYGATGVHWPRASADAGSYRALVRALPGGPVLVEIEFELTYQ